MNETRRGLNNGFGSSCNKKKVHHFVTQCTMSGLKIENNFYGLYISSCAFSIGVVNYLFSFGGISFPLLVIPLRWM